MTIESYDDGLPTQQRREDRPNPRWPQERDIETLVHRVRAVIASYPASLVKCQSPVALVVAKVLGPAGVVDDFLAAQVTEGALADGGIRFMLMAHGLHDGGKGRSKR